MRKSLPKIEYFCTKIRIYELSHPTPPYLIIFIVLQASTPEEVLLEMEELTKDEETEDTEFLQLSSLQAEDLDR